MKTTTISRGAAAALTLLLLTGAAAFPPSWAGAQDTPDPTECRCVDRNGNEIEDCTCVRMPRMDRLMARISAMSPRPRIGITLDAGQVAEIDARGARIDEVMDGGPADEAGLRAGDVVTSFDGNDLHRSLDGALEDDFDLDRSIPVQRLLALARRLEPGQEVEIDYLRDGEARRATLEARDLSGWGAQMPFPPSPDDLTDRIRFHRGPEGAPPAVMFRRRDAPGTFGRCPEDGENRGDLAGTMWGGGCPGGLRLVALNPDLGTYFGTDRGVLVADVHPDSALELQAGDVIQAIGDREVDTPERARRILRSYGADEPFVLHIVRDSDRMEVRGRMAR